MSYALPQLLTSLEDRKTKDSIDQPVLLSNSHCMQAEHNYVNYKIDGLNNEEFAGCFPMIANIALNRRSVENLKMRRVN